MKQTDYYWNQVLQEVIHKEQSDFRFYYTNIGPDQRNDSDEDVLSKQNKIKLEGRFAHLHLTPRECDCLFVLGEGKTIKEIAREMSLSPRTVEFYLKNLKAKFGCKSKTELLALVANSNMLRRHDHGER